MTYNVFSGTLNPTHFTSLQLDYTGLGRTNYKIQQTMKIARIQQLQRLHRNKKQK